MASFSFAWVKPIHLVFVALLIPLWGVILDRLGLLQLTVGFVGGILFVILGELLAIYYFILKIDGKQGAKRETLRKVNQEFIESPSGAASSIAGLNDPKSPATLKTRVSSLNANEKFGSVEGVKNTMEGTVTIQFIGKKKERVPYNCFINKTFFYYTKKREGKGPNMVFTPQAVQLEGCEVRVIEEDELKGVKYALELQHPQRKILYKIDYFYLIFDSEMDLQRWYFALLTICKPHNGYVDLELNRHLHERFSHFWNTHESANWLNAILSRFWLNIRQSASVRERLTEKMATRFAEKLEEKNLQEYIGEIKLDQIDLGSHPPTISSVILLPPDSAGDLLLDADLIYKNGTVKLSMSAEVYLKRFATVPVKMTVTLKMMAGRMQIRVAPFPAERFSISFYEEPKMDFDCDIGVGEKMSSMKSLILPKVKELVVDRIKLALIERFVAPHRKYFRIPTTPKSDPVAQRDPTVVIKTTGSSSNLLSSVELLSTSPVKSTPPTPVSSTSTSSMSELPIVKKLSDVIELDENARIALNKTMSDLVASSSSSASASASLSTTADQPHQSTGVSLTGLIDSNYISSSSSSPSSSIGAMDRDPSFHDAASLDLSTSPPSLNNGSDAILSTSPNNTGEQQRLSQRMRSRFDRLKKAVKGAFSDSEDAVAAMEGTTPPSSVSHLSHPPPSPILSTSPLAAARQQHPK